MSEDRHSAENDVGLTDAEVATLLHEFVCADRRSPHRYRGECERLAPRLRPLIQELVDRTIPDTCVIPPGVGTEISGDAPSVSDQLTRPIPPGGGRR